MNAQPFLKTKFSRLYNYQRVLYKDSTVISGWFALLCNIITKYSIQPKDLYNFDKTNFIMGVIISLIVVMRSDRRGKVKSI